MNYITDRLQEAIKTEGARNANDTKLKEFERLLEQMEQLDSAKKPEYSFPLVDTLGKNYYSTTNKHLSL